jgi:hypothetical protein
MSARKYVVAPDGKRIDCGKATNTYTHAVVTERLAGGWVLVTKTRSAKKAADIAANWRDQGLNALATGILVDTDGGAA